MVLSAAEARRRTKRSQARVVTEAKAAEHAFAARIDKAKKNAERDLKGTFEIVNEIIIKATQSGASQAEYTLRADVDDRVEQTYIHKLVDLLKKELTKHSFVVTFNSRYLKPYNDPDGAYSSNAGCSYELKISWAKP